ncbi:SDR family NAD(P)-dependent oxidoreductase [Streptomyces sp. cg40]|uniref:SDR family NAD(P)-dependent oxidoreductase n=1 Tax=Streptomyces sp. cg40 TaxID=3419764 RepID=UPI003D044530
MTVSLTARGTAWPCSTGEPKPPSRLPSSSVRPARRRRPTPATSLTAVRSPRRSTRSARRTVRQHHRHERGRRDVRLRHRQPARCLGSGDAGQPHRHVHLCPGCHPRHAGREVGRIVTIWSSSAQHGAPNMAHHFATKGGVIALSKALAVELAAEGITAPPSRQRSSTPLLP